MFTEEQMRKVGKGKEAWEKELQSRQSNNPERRSRFSTISDLQIKNIYSPEDLQEMDYERDLGFPSQYPFTRGVQPSMYRGQLWTMRMFAGWGSAEDTNQRFHYLVEQGQTGLSVAFDYPTLMGYDTDSPKARGECGKCGVAIDTLQDMEILLDGLPIDRLTTSMTINPPASILWAMYITVAEKRGIPRHKLGGTIQNDMLKEFIAQ
ncbi:MAG: methylmalonyl-CoA mutase family protein, partial [Deltaproteobacteria bacterium]|nr:methylmalonyl-CoA mutase family protein [Deltaproteobacteria bacterium]